MSVHSLSHLSDHELLRDLMALVARDHATTAALLAHLAEVDARKLYLPAAYPSLFAYCVHELHLSEDAAFRRIQAARTARQFPVIFDAVAEGRLHLTAVLLLAPYLTPGNADGLLAAAAHKTKSEVEELIAARFPRSEELAMMTELPASAAPADARLAPAPVAANAPEHVSDSSCQLAPARVTSPVAHVKVTPVAPERFLLQLTIGQGTHDKLRYAQELLSHEIPSGDVAEVLDRALDLLVARLEQRKFAATGRPCTRRRPTTTRRHIPAHVQRAVWERDGGQCTFVSEEGHRCPTRKLLEFDHIDPVARGGRATVDGMRLRCRAHNQFEAERTFGAAFMQNQRRAAAEARTARRAEVEAQARVEAEARARKAAAAERARAEAEARAARRAEVEAQARVEAEARARKAAAAERASAEAEARAARRAAAEAGACVEAEARACVEAEARARKAAAAERTREVIPWLRQLGLRTDEARRAAAHCEAIPDAPLEERVRLALSCSCARTPGHGSRRIATGPATAA